MNVKDKYNNGIFDPKGKNLNPLNNLPYTETYKNLSYFWSNLPAYKMAKDIVKSIRKNDVILIISQTGSGKSVLIPKYCLHVNNYRGLTIMTLPKKLITKATAEFSAKTLDVNLGEQVGYQYRGETMKSNNTNLLYSTDGSIVAMLKSDPTLKEVDILIIDEAHERKVQIDLLLYLIKNAIKIRKEHNLRPLKLVIMSATINEKLFKTYYKDFSYDYLFLSGIPNYPIKSIYLESELNISKKQYLEEGKKIIQTIVNRINSKDKQYLEGDILFFVCSVSECIKTSLELSENIKDAFVMAVYSGFNAEMEEYISEPNKYKTLNSNFKRRIFISTNVAESSLTISGIVYVIDSGLEISVKYDPNKKCNVMNKNIITKAQITQRKGRAGRTQAGICYHLYTPEQENKTNDFPEPEILKEDIKNLCLSLMKLGCQIYKKEFTVEETMQLLTNFIDPPLEKYIKDAFDYNISNNLIHNNILSKTGQLIVKSRMDICDGLTLLYAYNIDSNIFDKVFKIVCIQSYLKHGIDDLFNSDINIKKRENIIKNNNNNTKNSEHLLIYNLYNYIEKDRNSGLYNIKLINDINKLYNNQKEKISKIYSKYNIKIDIDINKDNLINIICAFNFGLKINKANKHNNNFKYNNIICNLKNNYLDFKKIKSIVFYSNLLINGKLNISIISPYLLRN
jgi:pre-mRNA-splicing factor ATP-dependent RNA helicase DHX15/PRP43